MCVNVYLGVHLLIDDVVLALFPVSSLHGLGGGHHVLPHTLRGTSQSLALAHSHHMVEVLTDHSSPGIHLMGYHVPKIVSTNWDLLLIRITQIYQFIIHSLHFFIICKKWTQQGKTNLPYKELRSTWLTLGRHIPVALGWCACDREADDASQSSPVLVFSRADVGAINPRNITFY